MEAIDFARRFISEAAAADDEPVPVFPSAGATAGRRANWAACPEKRIPTALLDSRRRLHRRHPFKDACLA